MKYDLMRKPYVPDKLVWYPEQPQWQRLVDSRLGGNLLEYSETVKSSDTRFTSSSRTSNIFHLAFVISS